MCNSAHKIINKFCRIKWILCSQPSDEIVSVWSNVLCYLIKYEIRKMKSRICKIFTYWNKTKYDKIKCEKIKYEKIKHDKIKYDKTKYDKIK